MHSISTFVFYLTLLLYLITIFTVSYVGVYVTYIALPVIIISGFIAYVTKPKDINKLKDVTKKDPTVYSELKKFLKEESKELNKIIKSDAEYLKDLNKKE